MEAASDAGTTTEWSIGHEVTLRTTFGDQLTGTVFAFDRNANALVLREVGSHSGAANLRVLKAHYVQEVISTVKPQQPVDLKLPHVDLERCRKREERELALAEAAAARVGPGVTKEAQAIFDGLAKTMPCKWKDKDIIVLDVVLVREPYTVDSVMADDGQAETLERIQKMLQAIRTQLGFT